MRESPQEKADRVILYWRLTTTKFGHAISDMMAEALGSECPDVLDKENDQIFTLVYQWKYQHKR